MTPANTAAPTLEAAATAPVRLRAWREDPVRFVRECFGVEPDPWQAEVLRAFPVNPRIALVACKGPGKSTCLSWLAWNFLATRPHPKIAATSITADNLRDNLWAEMSKWQERSPFLSAAFQVDTKRVYARGHEKTWFMSARSWNREASEELQGSTLAGLHADYVLFILDEAGGIPDAVAKAAEGGMSTGIETRFIIAGNPTHLSGPLYRAANDDRKLWKVFEITGDPDRADRAPRVKASWAREMIDRYGRGSSYVQVDVLGQFPSGATDAMVSRQQFEEAFLRWETGRHLATSPRTIGLDIARFGTDSSVLCFREGDLVLGYDDWQGKDTEYTSSRTMDSCTQWAGDIVRTQNPGVEPSRAEIDALAREIPIMVDDIGVGGGVTDKLIAKGFNVTGVNVGSSPADKRKFANLRAELNFHLQDRFEAGGIALHPSVRQGTTLVAEGTTLRHGYAAGTSKRQIESKKEYKKRTGRSPDYWDATVLAFHPGAGVPMVSF